MHPCEVDFDAATCNVLVVRDSSPVCEAQVSLCAVPCKYAVGHAENGTEGKMSREILQEGVLVVLRYRFVHPQLGENGIAGRPGQQPSPLCSTDTCSRLAVYVGDFWSCCRMPRRRCELRTVCRVVRGDREIFFRPLLIACAIVKHRRPDQPVGTTSLNWTTAGVNPWKARPATTGISPGGGEGLEEVA